MTKPLWYFLCGMAAVALPLALLFTVRALGVLETRPDATLEYARGPDGPLMLHVFHARGDRSPAPALLLFHGGGWVFGEPRNVYKQCLFFREQGYTCIAAQYRLGPPNPPDIRGAIDDAAAALAYLHDNAPALGIDPKAIHAGGGSAGGQLAAALGAGLHGADRLRPTSLVLLNPVLDLAPCTPFHHLAGEDWRALSPLQAVDADFPPALVLSGTRDVEVPVAGIEAFCAAVEASGGRCETAFYEGQGHGFFNPRPGEDNPYFERTNQRMQVFLDAL